MSDPEMDPWVETWADHVSWRLLLADALVHRDVPKVASLIGATEALGELAWLSDPKNSASEQIEMKRLRVIEDVVVEKLTPAIARDEGRLCGVWRVPCNARSHGVLAVWFMASFLRVVCEQWRPSYTEMYEHLVIESRKQIGEIREGSG